jgi:riboflavin kinase/FMN adenylyltransferase
MPSSRPTACRRLIYSLPQKVRAIEALGADVLAGNSLRPRVQPADRRSFHSQPRARPGPDSKHLRWGGFRIRLHKRSGNVPLLRQLGSELHFQVHGLAAVALDGQTVSSTRIRDAIRAGDFAAASQMLGPRLLHCRQSCSRRSTRAQARVSPPPTSIPPACCSRRNGVYAARAGLGAKTHRAVLNIGIRPTIQNPTPRHVSKFTCWISPATFTARNWRSPSLSKLRDEQKFPSVEALRAQIQKDVAAARAAFS